MSIKVVFCKKLKINVKIIKEADLIENKRSKLKISWSVFLKKFMK